MQGENVNFAGFSVSEAQIQQVLGSPEGRKLLSLLQKNGGSTLQTALSAAKNGDSAGAQQAMEQLLSSGEAASLLRRMGDG